MATSLSRNLRSARAAPIGPRRGWSITKEALEYGKEIIGSLVKFMTSGPVLMLAIEGNQAVAVVKKLVGETEPATSDVGTIRGDYTMDSYSIAAIDDRAVRNLMHCSDQVSEAEIGRAHV